MMMRKVIMPVFWGALACLLLAGALLFPRVVFGDECGAAFDQAAKQYYQHKKDSTLDAVTCRALIARFQAVADQYPDCAKADDSLYLVGLLGKMAYNQSKETSDLAPAEKAFLTITEKQPPSPLLDKAFFQMGEIHLLRDETAEAVKDYEKCAEGKDGKMAAQAQEKLSKLSPPTPPAASPKPGVADLIRADDASEAPAVPGPPPASPPLPAENSAPAPPSPKKPGGTDALAEQDLSAPPGDVPVESDDPSGKITIEQIIRGDSPAASDQAEKVEGPAPAPAVVSSPPPAPAGNFARLEAIRYWTNRDYTRVVIEVSRGVPFAKPVLLPADLSLGTPPRLFVDFAGTVISGAIMDPDTPEAGCFTLPIGDGLLKKARAGQYQPDVARVVLDIERIDRFNAFPLPGETFRYVIDVYGSPASTPVARAPDRKTSHDKNPPGREDRDSLGSWFKSTRPGEGRSGHKYIVVLDAGHGGKDPGARGPSGTNEKDIALAIAKDTKRAIERERNDVEVVLTRSDDRFISLVERTAIANTINADLFVSVHINAAKNRDAAGVETYYLDNTTDRAALKLAAKENFVAEEELLDTRDSTNRILADLITMSKVEDSVPLARSVQDNLVRGLATQWAGVNNKGVKKAPFWVLTGATMPCVLVEVGFISNRAEEKRLVTSEYQKAAAAGIAAGVSSYLDSYLQLSRNE